MGVRKLRQQALLDRSPTGNLFQRTLSQISTHFGRLMYLASLRDPNTGHYRHQGFAAAFGRDRSIEALAKTHRKLFRQWQAFDLRQRREDLAEYLASLDDPKGLVVEYWLETEGYANCIPERTGKASREFFLTDMARLLNGFRREAAAATRGQSS